MAKTITIPGDYDPYVVCIDGVYYSYKAGTTQSVPDEVAALIADIGRGAPMPAPKDGVAGWLWTRNADGTGEWQPNPNPTPYVPSHDPYKTIEVKDINAAFLTDGELPEGSYISIYELDTKTVVISAFLTNGSENAVSTTDTLFKIKTESAIPPTNIALSGGVVESTACNITIVASSGVNHGVVKSSAAIAATKRIWINAIYTRP